MFCVSGVPSLWLSNSMPCQWMPVGCAMLFLKWTMTVSPTFTRNSGPGIEPLNVSTLAICPCPMSTVFDWAVIVVSNTSGSGFVSTASGTVYGSPPEVASA